MLGKWGSNRYGVPNVQAYIRMYTTYNVGRSLTRLTQQAFLVNMRESDPPATASFRAIPGHVWALCIQHHSPPPAERHLERGLLYMGLLYI